ncbi:MAG: family 43 glycosylhydrolase [Lachnospiraceae bacterium]|nr:family 43 glycosylhydrolase [Lachnospiraceae bacterium]
MSTIYCNPISCEYKYQFNRNPMEPDRISVNREAADPSVIFFKGVYYLFASMTLSVWSSVDLVHWESHRLPKNLPLYGYAPDVRVIGDYVWFSASNEKKDCSFYRTKDVLNGPYEEIPGTMRYTDPNLFADLDGRIYFYWGCSNVTPIRGVELDQKNMEPISEVRDLICGDAFTKGYERIGTDNSIYPATEAEVEAQFTGFLQSKGMKEEDMDPGIAQMIRGFISRTPYIEGAWMNRFGDTYYLQYAFSGTEHNVYGDGVYESDSPLGPFKPARNNPYSFSPGGFMPGAGHGSTFEDSFGNLWHAGTMRISVNHNFERRVGIWPAGLDEDGELFCNQRFGDWPIALVNGKRDVWAKPQWYLLSHRKPVTASSFAAGHEPSLAAEEDVRTWWKAGTGEFGQWLLMDLEQEYAVKAVQINFADDHPALPVPEQMADTSRERYIEEEKLFTRWKLEASADGISFDVLEDKSAAETDLAHDLVILNGDQKYRYVKLTVFEVPYDQPPCISGLRVFGVGEGALPKETEYKIERTSDLDFDVVIDADDAVGHLILWGHQPDKLYHSCMVYGERQHIGALMKGETYYVRVDSFNESGITEGEVIRLKG